MFGAVGACTLALALLDERFPLQLVLYAHTVMFAQLLSPTLVFLNVVVVPLVHAPFRHT
jgi:hypothetical protein